MRESWFKRAADIMGQLAGKENREIRKKLAEAKRREAENEFESDRESKAEM